MLLDTYVHIYTFVDKRLLKQFNLIKEQNLTLIKASNNNSSHSGNNDNSEGNPLQAALVNSLQHQLHSIRDEVTNLYKHQNTSSQKLLNMNEILREREDNVRALEAENVSLKASVNRLSKAREDDFEGKRERERGIENLQDEIQTLKLELSQIEHRNQMLKNDNAVLIQRWLDRMNDEAEKMNDANEFYNELSNKQSNNIKEINVAAGATTDNDTETDDGFVTDIDKDTQHQ